MSPTQSAQPNGQPPISRAGRANQWTDLVNTEHNLRAVCPAQNVIVPWRTLLGPTRRIEPRRIEGIKHHQISHPWRWIYTTCHFLWFHSEYMRPDWPSSSANLCKEASVTFEVWTAENDQKKLWVKSMLRDSLGFALLRNSSGPWKGGWPWPSWTPTDSLLQPLQTFLLAFCPWPSCCKASLTQLLKVKLLVILPAHPPMIKPTLSAWATWAPGLLSLAMSGLDNRMWSMNLRKTKTCSSLVGYPSLTLFPTYFFLVTRTRDSPHNLPTENFCVCASAWHLNKCKTCTFLRCHWEKSLS